MLARPAIYVVPGEVSSRKERVKRKGDLGLEQVTVNPNAFACLLAREQCGHDRAVGVERR
jgi:hypothetical protein